MLSIKQVQKYCIDDISLIENYEKAIADVSQIWECHHRLEISDGKKTSRAELIRRGLYYSRPHDELIFLTKEEHSSIHHLGKVLDSETRKKVSNGHKGIRHSQSSDTRKKISESKVGEKNPMFGRKVSDETRAKLSRAAKRQWENVRGSHDAK